MSDNKYKHTKKIRIQMIAGFTTLIVLMLALIIIIFNGRMSSAMKSQMADMAEHLNNQINSNVETYMSSISDNVALLYYDEDVRKFVPGEAEDTAENREMISGKVDAFSRMIRTTDYGIIFADGSCLGTISLDIRDQYGDDLFRNASFLLNSKVEGWTTDLLGDHSRLFYLKQLNSKSIAVASVAATSLEQSLMDSIFIDGMNIYITDAAMIIQCSTDSSVKPGSYVKTNIYRLVDRYGSTQISDMYIVASKQLSNGWLVVTAVPNGDVLKVLHSTIGYIIFVAGIASIFAVVFVLFMTNRITDTVNKTVTKLDTKATRDLLTGLYNKRSFEEIVEDTLANPEPNMSYALVFMDVDNFKGVNDKCGHNVGDEVLRSFAHTIDAVFRDGDIKGRLGGDEFCVLMKLHQSDNEQLISDVNEVCKRFKDALYKKATSARQSLPAVTSSMGAALWESGADDFEAIYHRADVAVYASKKKGKNTWSIYGVDDVNEDIL